MLFNSLEFIYLFLPITIGLCLFFKSYYQIILIAASTYFYYYWSPFFTIVLISSIIANYLILHLNSKRPSYSKTFIAVSLNLLLLAYYKYYNFFVSNINFVFDSSLFNLKNIILPLGISFFTFQQITCHVDIYKGEKKDFNFFEYYLYITFFPQLIAGPIVHYKKIIPQFKSQKVYQFKPDTLYRGMSYFIIGLLKKVIIADSIAILVSQKWEILNKTTLTIASAWEFAIGYSLQLYFDFSGYADIAIGLGLFFGIIIPKNFSSPYSSSSFIDFWKRWHISLSLFLKDYVYIPLGGNRGSRLYKYRNIFITMIVGGFWHGANWSYIIWGGIHAVCITINHIFRDYFPRILKLPRLFNLLLVNLLVILAWVIFRTESTSLAMSVYRSMLSFRSFEIGESAVLAILVILYSLTTFLPNSHQLTDYLTNKSIYQKYPVTTGFLSALLLLLVTSCLYIMSLEPSYKAEFLYYQF